MFVRTPSWLAVHQGSWDSDLDHQQDLHHHFLPRLCESNCCWGHTWSAALLQMSLNLWRCTGMMKQFGHMSQWHMPLTCHMVFMCQSHGPRLPDCQNDYNRPTNCQNVCFQCLHVSIECKSNGSCNLAWHYRLLRLFKLRLFAVNSWVRKKSFPFSDES